eukprot:c17975_g1_i1 orf=98-523(-)
MAAPSRRRLSDITNTSTATGVGESVSQMQKGNVARLQKEVITLRKELAEKEALIMAQKQQMERLWSSYSLQSRQNDEIIHHNAQICKDLMQARENLKVLQHENAQMTAVHRAIKTELELRLSKTLEQLNSVQENKVNCTVC